MVYAMHFLLLIAFLQLLHSNRISNGTHTHTANVIVWKIIWLQCTPSVKRYIKYALNIRCSLSSFATNPKLWFYLFCDPLKIIMNKTNQIKSWGPHLSILFFLIFIYYANRLPIKRGFLHLIVILLRLDIKSADLPQKQALTSSACHPLSIGAKYGDETTLQKECERDKMRGFFCEYIS